MRTIGGLLEGNKVQMILMGYFTNGNTRIGAYYKADSNNGRESDGKIRCYTMSRCNGHNIFYLETEDD